MEDQENNNTINHNNSVERQHRYRALLNTIEEINESNDVGLQTVNEIKDILGEVNTLNDQCDIKSKVMTPEEILLDSLVLSQASDILLKCTKAVNITTANYEPVEFATKIAERIKSSATVEQLDLLNLMDDARDIVEDHIECSFLYGTFDLEHMPPPKEQTKTIKIKERQAPAAKKELLAVNSSQTEQEDGNEGAVLFLLKILQEEYKKSGEKPLKYFNFVIDSDDFTATIENMFYFSFLIRDGRAKLEVIENVPYISPTHTKDLKQFRHNNGVNTQMINSMDMEQWDMLKTNIREGYVQKYRKSLRKSR